MKKLKTVIVGCGNRACTYAEEGVKNLGLMEIVACVDPDEVRLKYMRDNFGVKEEYCFKNLNDLLALGKIGDCVINGTMDQLHYETSIPLLEQGYDMLLEKPVVNNKKQLLEIKETAEKHDCKLLICHVLRYAPFYKEIKRIISTGEIGEIMNIQTSERVGAFHSSVSYIRGKWNSRKECGSSLLLAKCCHDLDLLCWLNNSTKPSEVESMGGRDYFIPEKAPKGSGTRCLVDCPTEIREKCVYDVKSMYLDNCLLPWYPWQCTGKDWEDVTYEEKVESLKTYNPHGRCIYKCGGDIVDHQNVSIKFENGSTATHATMLGCMKAGRTIWVLGTEGELEGNADEGMLKIRKYDKKSSTYTEHSVNFNDTKGETGGHFGGDKGLVQDFCNLALGKKKSISCTSIEDSINGHLLVYAADEALEKDCPIKL